MRSGCWAARARTALEADPVYASLQEVRENRVVFTDGVVAGAEVVDVVAVVEEGALAEDAGRAIGSGGVRG